MADPATVTRPLLTPDQLVLATKLWNEYSTCSPSLLIDAPDETPVRIQTYGAGGWRSVGTCKAGELKVSMSSRFEARRALIRDQLLEYGVAVPDAQV